MATYLVVKSGNQTKSYTAKTTADKPYMRVGTGYFPLTSETTTASGLRVKLDNKPYRIVETYYTTISTTTSTEYATTRSSQYNTESYSTVDYVTTTTGQAISQSMVYVPLNISTTASDIAAAYTQTRTYPSQNMILSVSRNGTMIAGTHSYSISIRPMTIAEVSNTISVRFSSGETLRYHTTVKNAGETYVSVSSTCKVPSNSNAIKTMRISYTHRISTTYTEGIADSVSATQASRSNTGLIAGYDATFYFSTVTQSTRNGTAITNEVSAVYNDNTMSVVGLKTGKGFDLSTASLRQTYYPRHSSYTLLYFSAQYLQTGSYMVIVNTQTSSRATVTYTTSRQSDYTTTSEVETTSQVTTQ